MPELLVASLEARVERAVAAVISARRAELERLVQDRVDAELQHLAEELVAAQLANGNGAPEPRVCASCGNEPAMPGRRIGRACKTKRDLARERERRARSTPANDDGPRTGPDAQPE